MNAATTQARKATLKAATRSMDPDHAEQIRQAYYKAAEGLRALEDLLGEAADNCPPLETQVFKAEQRIAKRAQQALDTSDLGAIL